MCRMRLQREADGNVYVWFVTARFVMFLDNCSPIATSEDRYLGWVSVIRMTINERTIESYIQSAIDMQKASFSEIVHFAWSWF
mmetsp:Transcript_18943/g.61624  ORF Transcript_18943/g.61624 Transcript_18943/m.61624 type:complete len:83 (+) Transcript_18943:1728-1976(+)